MILCVAMVTYSQILTSLGYSLSVTALNDQSLEYFQQPLGPTTVSYLSNFTAITPWGWCSFSPQHSTIGITQILLLQTLIDICSYVSLIQHLMMYIITKIFCELQNEKAHVGEKTWDV